MFSVLDGMKTRKRVHDALCPQPYARLERRFIPIENADNQERGLTQLKFYEIGSKVHQSSTPWSITVCLNISILAVIQIFCSKVCSYINKKVEKGA